MVNTALQNISSSMHECGNNICKSIDLLAHAMIASNQSQPQAQRNQATYVHNTNTTTQTTSVGNRQILQQLGENQHQLYEQLLSGDSNIYQSL